MVSVSKAPEPAPIDLQLAHQRLAHISVKAIDLLARGDIARGLVLKPSSLKSRSLECVPCLKGQMKRKPAPKKRTSERASKPLELVHVDICGRWQWHYLLKKKSDAAKVFKDWMAEVERETGHKLKRIRSDNGGEFSAGQFLKELENEGVVLETTAPYDHHQAGAKHLWGEISSAVVYLKNRSPTSALDGRTPFEAYKGRIPDLRRLRALGCKAVAHRPKETRKGKLSDRAVEGVLVGYYETSKAYRIWDPVGRKIIKSNDVVFFEEEGRSERVRILGREAGDEDLGESDESDEVESAGEHEDAEHESEASPSKSNAIIQTQRPTTSSRTRTPVVTQIPTLRRSDRLNKGQHP